MERTTTTAPALFVLCTAQFVLQLDFSIVNVALNTIQAELAFSPAGLQWVVTAYALTFGSLLLLGGRLGDLVGRRRLLLVGLWVFALASLAGGLAPSPGWLVGARFVQGAGAALVAPTVLSMLTAIHAEGEARTRALGLWTAATAAGGTTGIVAGGVLTQYLGWRSIFLVNLPLIGLLIPLALRSLPATGADRSHRLDLAGAVLSVASIGSLIFGLSDGEQRGFGSPVAVAAFALFAVLAAAFVAVERTVAEPMVPFGFLRPPVRRSSTVVMFAVGGIVAAYAYFAALYLQRGLGYSEAKAALGLVPPPLTIVATSMLVTRRLIGRTGIKRVLLLGLASVAAGQCWLAQATETGTYLGSVLPGLLFTAFGIGLVFPGTSVGVTSSVEPHEQGLAGGLLTTAQQVGAAICVAVLATIASTTGHGAGHTVVDGYRSAYLVATGIALVAFAVITATRFGARPAGSRAMPARRPGATSPIDR
jgi:MFS family permease